MSKRIIKDNDYEIQEVLVVSTKHITEKDNNLLKIDTISNECDLIIDSFPYGYYIYIPDNSIENTDKFIDSVGTDKYSKSFKNLLRIAKEKGFDYIKLDADGKVYDHLETFKW